MANAIAHITIEGKLLTAAVLRGVADQLHDDMTIQDVQDLLREFAESLAAKETNND